MIKNGTKEGRGGRFSKGHGDVSPVSLFKERQEKRPHVLFWHCFLKSSMIIFVGVRSMLYTGVDGCWCALWSSKPVFGVDSLMGGFDSHILPPIPHIPLVLMDKKRTDTLRVKSFFVL